MKLSKLILNIKPSATLEVVNKVNQLRSQGEKVVSFGAGEPDFDTPKCIREYAKKAIDDGFTHYTSVGGIKELKTAIIKKLKKDNNIEYTYDEILVSNGAKHSLFNMISTIINPGDEVLISTPFWVSYSEIIKLAGGVPVFVETKFEEGFLLKANYIEKKITDKTKLIIINTPNNPTGAVMDREELIEISKLSLKYDLYIISDEIYEKLTYEKKHFSIASISEEVKKRIITINGVSKAYAMTGWRIGYAAGDKEIIKNASTLQGHTTSNPNSIAQKAAIAALEMDESILDEMKTEFLKRRNYMYNEFKKMKKFKLPPQPEGAFYIFLNIDNFNMTSKEFCNYALDKVKVAVVPGIAFGVENFVRVSYANSMEEIVEGLNRLKKL